MGMYCLNVVIDPRNFPRLSPIRQSTWRTSETENSIKITTAVAFVIVTARDRRVICFRIASHRYLYTDV